MTAVGWLFKQFFKVAWKDMPSRSIMFEQAKEIEKKNAIGFYNWMKKEECESSWEQYFHYTDEDMYNEYLKQKHNES